MMLSNIRFFATTAEQIEAICLAVSITVIVLLFITLAISFYLYYRYYRRCIDNYLEDNYIRNEIRGENRKFFKSFDALLIEPTLTREEKVNQYNEEPLVDYVENQRAKNNGLKIFTNIMLGVVYVLFVAMMCFVGYVRASGEQFNIGNTTYVVIMTGSMNEARDSNTYLAENKLTNQITTLSLIGLDKIESEDDVKLYDIVAYYNLDREFIVHRVINISTNELGQTTYTLRGDANAVSSTDERNLTFDKLLYKFNGYQNFGLGLFINYIRSNIGIITISLALILIMVYDFFDILLGRRINNRKDAIYPLIDEENIKLLLEYEYMYLDPSYDLSYVLIYDPRDGFASNEEYYLLLKQLKHRPGFLKALDKRNDPSLNTEYEELKNYCLSYGMRGVFTKDRLDFHINGIRFISFCIEDGYILAHYKLKSVYYAHSIMEEMLFDDTNNQKEDYDDIMMGFYLEAEIDIRWAKVLIDDMMIRNRIERKTPFISFYPEN